MEETQTKFIDIRPLSKWKRFLVFFGDYFVSFIVSFILFNLLVFPVGKIICSTESKIKEAASYEEEALVLLKDNGILFRPNDTASFDQSVNYTFKVFLSYYAFDDVEVDENNKQYGHKLENEVIRHYYESVILDTAQYINDFKDVNAENEMFTIGETVDSIALKSDYKVLLSNELLEVKDESKYSVAMTNFRDNVFARLFYLKVYSHILDNDFVKDGVSYNTLLQKSRDTISAMEWVATVSTLISIFLSWGLLFLLYPLINKEKRTITMSAMQISKLHYKSLSQIDNKSVLIQSFYHFVFLLSQIVFLPVLFFGIGYCFNLPLLFVLSAISLVLMIFSGMFIFFNQHNRSGSDILTSIVLVPTSELDNLYIEELRNGN